jgi:lamin tail-like protein/type IX secretion system substrate protein
MKKMAYLFILLFAFSQTTFGQTVLSAGDIAITGVNMDNPDEISIVFLVDIEIGTEIKFTDNGWKADNTWRTGEGIHVWTASTTYSAGEEIVIELTGPLLTVSGDQVISYQNISDMVAAINDEGAHVWQADAAITATSTLPQGLTNGTNCVALNETDNIIYDRSITTGTQAEILAAINDYTKWSGSNTVRQSLSIAGYTVAPSPHISVSPTSLSSFVYLSGLGPSTEPSFKISGSNLTADISIDPPPNYEISTGTGGSFSATNPITLSQSVGSVTESTIYTRLKAGLSIGSYSNENITASSPGAMNKNVACSGAVLPNLVINEILADPDLTDGDANGDGFVSSSQDEFVEIINNELTTQDFGGYTLSNSSNIRHTFPPPTNIPAGESIVVFGGGTPTFINGTTQIASNGALNLNNAGDDVILKSGSMVIASYTYGSEGGDNQSLGRNPDITGDFAKHSTFAPDAVLFSPGDRNDDSSPLPVELTSFTAKLKRGSVYLNWATATEVNNYGFYVERSLTGLDNSWETIGFVEGHGNSNSPKAYSFFDASTQLSTRSVSYRLKQIDTDGGFEYSDVVTITNEIVKTKLFQNHPNPFNPSTEISFLLAEAGKVNVSVYNVLGEKVAELVNQDLDEGIHKVDLNANDFASGFYFYRLETSTYAKTMKMLLIK